MGPLELLDGSLSLSRRAGWSFLWRCWAGSALLAAPAVGLFYVERVEGVSTMRLPFAALLVLGYYGRALLLASAAATAVRLDWPDAPTSAAHWVGRLRLASVVALGLSFWLWPLALASWVGPLGLALVLPLLSLRGAVAPAWIARAGCEPHTGFAGFFRAAADSSNVRASGWLSELILLLGVYPLFANLGGVVLFVLGLGKSGLGLDVAAVDGFLSLSNTFFLLLLGIVTLALFEPVRVARSALVYVHARVRQEGFDLVAAVDEAIARTTKRDRGRKLGGAALVVALSAAPGTTLAQTPDAGVEPLRSRQHTTEQSYFADPAAAEPEVSLYEAAPVAPIFDAADDEARGQIRDILAGDAYREFSDGHGEGFQGLMERLYQWLLEYLRELEPPDLPLTSPFALPMPPAWFFLAMGGALLLGVLLYLFVTRHREQALPEGASAFEGDPNDPRERAPAAHLDDAAQLALAGRHREALRALYLATLVALDRRSLIAFDPTRTNWHYLRQMPRGELRAAFAGFTKLFDYKWYGDEQTTRADYERGRAMADRICVPEEGVQ